MRICGELTFKVFIVWHRLAWDMDKDTFLWLHQWLTTSFPGAVYVDEIAWIWLRITGRRHGKSHYCDDIMSAMASQTTSFRVTVPRHRPLCGDFPAQRASDAKNVSISWLHCALKRLHKNIRMKSSNVSSLMILDIISCAATVQLR